MAHSVSEISSPYLDRTQLASLVEAARRDKERNFGALYRYAWAHVLYFATGLLKDVHEAEDCAQQTFLALFEKIEDLQEPQAALAYIDRATSRTAHNISRSKRRHRASSLDELVDNGMATGRYPEELSSELSSEVGELAVPGASLVADASAGAVAGAGDDDDGATASALLPDSRLSEEERNQLVYDLVLELPESLRECVFLRYWGEYHNNEIAAILNVSENVVAVRLKRARARLASGLQDALTPEGQVRSMAAALLGIGESLSFMASRQQYRAPREAVWMKAATGGAGSGTGSGATGAGAGIGAKLWPFLVFAAALLLVGGAYAAVRAMNSPEKSASQPPSQQAGAPAVASAPTDSAGDGTAMGSAETTGSATSTDTVAPSGGANAGGDPAPQAPAGAADAGTGTGTGAASKPAAAAGAQDQLPAITLAHDTVTFAAANHATLAQVLAAAGAQANAADGTRLSLQVNRFTAAKMTYRHSFLLFLHATDAAGRQAPVKTLQVIVTE